MSTDTFVVYSTARIARDEYTGWLHQVNAVMIPEKGGAYDARLSKDIHHIWISLLEGKWFDMGMKEFEDEPEVLANICKLLGGEPRSAIVLDANKVEGSQILAVQFAALCAERYPCVVLQAAGQAIFPAQEVLELRDTGMGFDGFTWETADLAYSFSWGDLEIREELGDSSKDQMFARSDTPEGRDKEQLGA